MLLLQTRAQGRNLYWASGKPVMLKIPESFRNKYFPWNDTAKQEDWNKDPYILMTFSPDNAREYFMGYSGVLDKRFPPPEEIRTLCVFPADHPQSLAMSAVLQYHDDIMEKTLLDLEDYKRKYENIQSTVEQFNDLDGTDEDEEETQSRLKLEPPETRRKRETDDCVEAEVSLIDGTQYIANILKELRLTPSNVQQLVDECRVYFSSKSRDFLSTHQAEIRDRENQASGSLKKIRTLIPQFLEITRKWYGVVDKIFTELPLSTNDIDVTPDTLLDMFKDHFEVETVISTSVTLTLSFIFNIILITYMTRKKNEGNEDRTGDIESERGASAPAIHRPTAPVGLPPLGVPRLGTVGAVTRQLQSYSLVPMSAEVGNPQLRRNRYP